MKPPAPSVLLYILHSGNLYGTERMALSTISGLEEYHERVVFAPPGSSRGSVLAAAHDAGLRTATFGSRQALVLKLLPWFIRYRSIDVIGTGVVHSMLCHMLGRLLRVRLRQLHVAHGGTADSLNRKHELNRIPCTVVAVSAFVKDALIQRGVLPKKVTVIENFLPPAQPGLSRRVPYDPAAGGARPVDRSRIQVAVVSRVDAFKRVDVLLESGLPSRFPDFQFDVYGTGDQFDHLKAVASSMPNVRLHGFVPDVDQRLANADVLLHLCPEEPFGLVILEAFRARLLVVGPDAGGIGQLIEDGADGLRFRANDAEDLARVFDGLRAMSDAQYQRIADAGSKKLVEKFGQDVGVDRYREALACAAT